MRSAHDGFNVGPCTLVRESTAIGGAWPRCIFVVVGPVARYCILAPRCKLPFRLADLVRTAWSGCIDLVATWLDLAWFTTLLCSLPTLVVFPPLFRATFDGLSLGMTAPIMVLVVLFAGTLVPLGGSLVAPEPKYWRKAVGSARPQL